MASTRRFIGKVSFGRALRFTTRRSMSRMTPAKEGNEVRLKSVESDLTALIARSDREGVNKRYVESWRRMRGLLHEIQSLPPETRKRIPFEAVASIAALGLTHGIESERLSLPLSALRYLLDHAKQRRAKLVSGFNFAFVTLVRNGALPRVDSFLEKQSAGTTGLAIAASTGLSRAETSRSLNILLQMGLIKRTRISLPGKTGFHYLYVSRHIETLRQADAPVQIRSSVRKKGSVAHLYKRKMTPAEQAAFGEWLSENIGLVHTVAERFQSKFGNFLRRIGFDRIEDLEAEAMMGARNGFLVFEPARGVKLSTYLYKCMESELKHLASRFNAKKRARDSISLNQTREFRKSREGTLLDRLVVEQPAPLLREPDRNRVRELLAESKLNERERFVIIERFGLNGRAPRTLADIGKELRLTDERIRQIEARVLEKLRVDARVRQFGEQALDE